MNTNNNKKDAGNLTATSATQNINSTMSLPIQSDDAKKNHQALIIRVLTRLPKSIKSKLQKMGALWYEAYQGYAIPLAQKSDVENLLALWSKQVSFSEMPIDLEIFTSAGKSQNNQELKISILQENIYKESTRLMVDIHAYDSNLTERDFDEKPSLDGKTEHQIHTEASFFVRRQELKAKRCELEMLAANIIKLSHGDNPYILDENGLWHIDQSGKTWISSPIWITARIRDESSSNHGKLIEFDDADNVHHIWSMPMEMLAGDGSEFRRKLMSDGLEISTNLRARQWLVDYVQRSSPSCTARCMNRTGWYQNGFVLPDINIGDFGKEKVLMQGKTFNGYAVSGTLQDWQNCIAHLCTGNSRLIFAISAGFAGPLLHLLGIESGGFHFCSYSSSGKTTALRVAASVYGNKDFMRKWKATKNGIEVIAFLHNDGLLCLDEIGEMEPSALGDTAYMLANGTGKARSRSEGGLRETLTWRLLFLSSGETGLAGRMEQAGEAAKTGQEIRLAEIPADTGIHGIFEEIHDRTNGAMFADELKSNALKYYGTAGRAFIEYLTRNRDEAIALIQSKMSAFLKAIPEGSSGQIQRVATRFALVAAAGELSIQCNLTRVLSQNGLASIGWDQGAAHEAAIKCFQSWLENFGNTDLHEKAQIIADTKYFLEQHEESRFTDWYAKSLEPPTYNRTHNRAGFCKHTSEGTEFYIFIETFKRDICKGRNEKFVKQTLFECRMLKKDGEGKFTCSAKPSSEARSKRFYVVPASPLVEE